MKVIQSLSEKDLSEKGPLRQEFTRQVSDLGKYDAARHRMEKISVYIESRAH